MAKSIREPFNALSHLAGAILALLGTVYLLVIGHSTVAEWISFLVFGSCAIFLYVSSSIYHWTGTAKTGLQKMDHSAIYAMIAGCYTPVCLLAMNGATGWVVLALQWALAITGIVLTIVLRKPPAWVRLCLYLVMGWMALPFVGSIARASSTETVTWLLLGGLAYTVGVIFYTSRKPILWPGKFSGHEVWHLFVLGGTACHFMLMRGLVLR